MRTCKFFHLSGLARLGGLLFALVALELRRSRIVKDHGVFRVSTNRTLLCLLALAGGAIGQQSSYRYDTAGITLHGTLIERRVHRPQGHGETPAQDAHETILILKLPQPIISANVQTENTTHSEQTDDSFG